MNLVTTPMLAASWSGFLVGLFITLFLFSCVLLICVVLVQKGRGGGLSSAFGGAGGASPFGTKTGDVFTWITVVLAAIFLLASLVLNGIVEEEKFHVNPDNPTPTQQGPSEGPAKTAGQASQPGK